MKIVKLLALTFAVGLGGGLFAQQMVYNWLPANDETVQLDPADYHAGRVYRPGQDGGNLHVDIEAQQPITIEMVPNDEWNQALQHPQMMPELHSRCVQQHVTKATYTCHLTPGDPIVLILQDERNANRSAVRGLGALLSGHAGQARQLVAPNNIHIQYYSWACVENCNPPQFQWTQIVKEKYQLTQILKTYGGITPDRDGEQLSVKIKSPVPMAIAVVRSSAADQLHEQPGTFETVLAGSSCKQRGIQSMTFQCALNASDGPQSLIVIPEPGVELHSGKKAELEVLEMQCVANCTPPANAAQQPPSGTPQH